MLLNNEFTNWRVFGAIGYPNHVREGSKDAKTVFLPCCGILQDEISRNHVENLHIYTEILFVLKYSQQCNIHHIQVTIYHELFALNPAVCWEVSHQRYKVLNATIPVAQDKHHHK